MREPDQAQRASYFTALALLSFMPVRLVTSGDPILHAAVWVATGLALGILDAERSASSVAAPGRDRSSE